MTTPGIAARLASVAQRVVAMHGQVCKTPDLQGKYFQDANIVINRFGERLHVLADGNWLGRDPESLDRPTVTVLVTMTSDVNDWFTACSCKEIESVISYLARYTILDDLADTDY